MTPIRAAQKRTVGAPRTNAQDLVLQTVAGQITDPVIRATPNLIGQDGHPRILPGPGGIVISHRVGDRCVGLEADHLEPGVAILNDQEGANLALQTYACIGNTAVVLDGDCAGSKGVVIGKHGGVNHVLIDFPTAVLMRLRIGDRIQVYACGLGLQLLDHPQIRVMNCSGRLVRSWGLRSEGNRLFVPVTHLIPAAIMGSGLGRDNAVRGDCDIQLFDEKIVRRFRLDRLRFGDVVAIAGADNRFGRSFHSKFMSIGIVVHSDSTMSGHGPGVTTLLTGESRSFIPRRDPQANIAKVLGIRQLAPSRAYVPLLRQQQHLHACRPGA
jgi:Domain of unknown function (DUF4438), N-terminal/Domain of unknown function (DUF4438), C-terminal